MSSQNTQQQGPESERHRPKPDQQQGNSDQFGQAGEPGLPQEDGEGWRPEERSARADQADEAATRLEGQQSGDSIDGGAPRSGETGPSAPEGQEEKVQGSGF